MAMDLTDFNQVPRLATTLTGPLPQLEQHLLTHQVQIETWLRQQFQQVPPPLTCSVDLRNAGFKIAPVDTNLFPAGFNNLNKAFLPLCIQAAQSAINQAYPRVSKILIIPESHTRNLFYFESLATLASICQKAGFDVRIGTLREDIGDRQVFTTAEHHPVILEAIQRDHDEMSAGDFKPELILLNNDLAEGIPAIFNGLKQPIAPLPILGWSTRLKSHHFQHYQEISQAFAAHIQLDPWLINPLFRNCGEVDFLKSQGMDCLIQNSKALFAAIGAKYNEYGIDKKPFLIIKADAGTYGMGIMTIQDPAELEHLSRKQRAHMSVTKGRQAINKVILQEGVYTEEVWGEGDQHAIAEPVVYMIGSHVIGGFYRVHKNRGVTENLNAPGMQFEPLAFATPCNTPNQQDVKGCPNRFYAYGVIARLALLAAGHEVHRYQHGVEQ